MLLRNCTLIPELSGGIDFRNADIELENGKIKAVLKSGGMNNYPGEEMDLKGKTVLPGFIDLHVHLGNSAGRVLDDNIRPMGTQVLDALKYAQDTLKAGFTTIRDAGSPYGLAIALREAINDGKFIGPDIIACGKVLTPTEIGNDFYQGLYAECNGYADALAKTREEFKAGADYIKVMGSGAFMNPGGDPGMPIALDEELRAMVQTASMRNSYVAIHAHGKEAIRQAIRCGVRCIEHGSLVDEAGIEELKAGGSFLVPTVIAMFTWDNETRDNPKEWSKIEPLLKNIETSYKAAYTTGLKLGFGTDMGVPDCFHGENGKEFIMRHEIIGMKPLDILLQATKHSAEIAMIDNKKGTIEAGKDADLVVVGGDPLENIYSVVDSIYCVIKKGIKIDF